MKFALVCLLVGTVWAAGVPRAAAQAPAPIEASTPAPLRVFLLTLGPGSHPFFKFGHNAIWIEDQRDTASRSAVYNFGTFAFDSPDLIPKFIMGRFTYWLSVAGIEETLSVYQYSNRSIVAQELNLTSAQAAGMARALDENAQPDKREYLYDYFFDNCSTRVRDALDRAVGGALRRAMVGPAEQTFRQHALRLTADLPWEYVALHFGLAGTNDRRLTTWDEGFIPAELQRSARAVRLPAADGLPERPFVKAERVLFASTRAPPPDRPPGRTLWFLLTGLTLGGVLFALARRAAGGPGRARTAARVGLGISLSLIGLLCGVLGSFLAFVWGFTDHRAGHANQNLFLSPPWLLLLAGLGLALAWGNARAGRIAWILVAATLATALLGLPAKLLPGFIQDNTAFVAFFLPLWLGLAAGLRRLVRPVTP